ncbi:YchJ family protein [Halioxenophilus aromaticivorans]|uniref:YchJ family protein n=1 Tax=Halioxenophilus aromaticivorans TaxID=1306992 RepID=A0AAV3TZ35_9ALTE
MPNPSPSQACPCGTDKTYAQCCQLYHASSTDATPDSAEQLMRSRFCAFAKAQWHYLYRTGPTDEPAETTQHALADWSSDKTWLSLRILNRQAGGPEDKEGMVEFVAFYRDHKGLQQHHERSDFTRNQKGQWQFVDGVDLPAIPLGRNEPCPCGSAKKYKRCCSV